MTNVPLPVISAPGRHPQASGGRLINCYPEKLSPTAGAQMIYPRVPGLDNFAATSGAFRGAIFVNNVLYAVIDTNVIAIASDGSTTFFTGSVSGTAPVFLSRNNDVTPDIVVVSPGVGAYQIVQGTNSVIAYPDGDVLTPDAVDFLLGFFVFTYGDGTTRTSDVNTTSINSLNYATAESKPDTLYRPMPLGNGQLLLAGANSIEVWGGPANVVGYPFSYVSTINRGIVGPYAMAGSIDGFGKGVFFTSDDFKVYTLSGYTPQPISSTDVELLVESDPNKQNIRMGVFTANGHGFVVVQGTNWCWVYETDSGTWHERKSYELEYWRGTLPVMAWNKWYCGDLLTGQVMKIDGAAQDELGNPLRKRIETGPLGAFPKVIRINTIELYCTKGVGIATGTTAQINPALAVAVSRDGGETWGAERILRGGVQVSDSVRRLRSSIWGQAEVQGVRWRIDETAAVNWNLMTMDMLSDTLR